MPKVYNKHHNDVPPDAIYVGRGSPWGNPYKIGLNGSRKEVLRKYKNYLDDNPSLILKIIKELKGKDLVCFCAPQPCHGNILLTIANTNDISEIYKNLK